MMSLDAAEMRLRFNNRDLVLSRNAVFEADWSLTGAAPTEAGKHFLVHEVNLEQGKTYLIDLKSKQFDAFLRLESRRGEKLREDDESGGDHNARIEFTPDHSGTFRLVATTFGTGQVGAYELTVVTLKYRSRARGKRVRRPAYRVPRGSSDSTRLLDGPQRQRILVLHVDAITRNERRRPRLRVGDGSGPTS